MSNGLDRDQDGHSVGPDLFAKVQQMKKVAASKERVTCNFNHDLLDRSQFVKCILWDLDPKKVKVTGKKLPMVYH